MKTAVKASPVRVWLGELFRHEQQYPPLNFMNSITQKRLTPCSDTVLTSVDKHEISLS